MMQNYERQIVKGREIEFRSLSGAEFRLGNVRYQVWAILPGEIEVLIGETANRNWAFGFVRMIPTACEDGKIQVVIVESNGLKQKTLGPASGNHSVSDQQPIHGSRLKRHQGGRIDWASYGREE